MNITDIIGNVANDRDNITDKNVNIYPWSKHDLNKEDIFGGELNIVDHPYSIRNMPEGYKVKHLTVKNGKYIRYVAVLIYKIIERKSACL
jgi:hypothetical protein